MHRGMRAGFGLVLVGLGALLMFGRLLGINLIGLSWPFFIVVPGLLFFVAMAFGGEAAGPLAIPGSVVTTLGLLLLYQNTFDAYESWSFAWALLPAAAGVGLVIYGAWSSRRGAVVGGLVVLATSLLMFLVFGIAFEALPGVARVAERTLGTDLVGDMAGALWPFCIVVPGLVLLVITLAGGRYIHGLAVPASIVTMVGLILLYQNTFGRFESWAYAWALIPAAVGFGLIVSGLLGRRPSTIRSGMSVMAVGMVLFLAGAFFFEGILNIGGYNRGLLGGIFWPLLLIGAGVLLLLGRGRSSSSATVSPSESSEQHD